MWRRYAEALDAEALDARALCRAVMQRRYVEALCRDVRCRGAMQKKLADEPKHTCAMFLSAAGGQRRWQRRTRKRRLESLN